LDYNIRASRGGIQLSFKRIQDILLDVDYRITSGGGGGATTWGSITGTLGSQTDLASALSGKQAAGSYASSVHTHAISDVTGLQTALDGKQTALSFSDASVTLPDGAGYYEYSSVISDASIVESNDISCYLAPHIDSDENANDMLSLRSISALAGNGSFTVNMSFDERTSGVVKFKYIAL